jgi:hypothetical protein
MPVLHGNRLTETEMRRNETNETGTLIVVFVTSERLCRLQSSLSVVCRRSSSRSRRIRAFWLQKKVSHFVLLCLICNLEIPLTSSVQMS